MINPSASGWIDKFFIEQKFSKDTVSKTTDIFYQKVRDTGFIYGHIIAFETATTIQTKGWFKEEISKVALLNTLYQVFCLTNEDISPENFIKQGNAFYNQMNPQGFNLFKKILPKNSPALTLEKIIDEFGTHLHDAPIDGWSAQRNIEKVVSTHCPYCGMQC